MTRGRKEGRETESFYQQKKEVNLLYSRLHSEGQNRRKARSRSEYGEKGEQGKVFRGLYDAWVYCQIVLDVQISQR